MNNYKVPPREMTPPVYAAEGTALKNIATGLGIDVDKLKRDLTNIDNIAGITYGLGSDYVGNTIGGIIGQKEKQDFTKDKSYSAGDYSLSSQLKEKASKPTTYIAPVLSSLISGGPLGSMAISKGLDYMAENSDEAKQRQAEAAMRAAGVNPLAKEYASVGDYGIDDTDPTMGAIPGDYSPPSSSIASTKSNVLDMVNQAAQASLAAKEAQSAQQKAATYNDKDFNSAVSAAIAEEIGTTPSVSTPTVVSTPATYNDKDFGGDNDLGQTAPAGGYQSYSGEDVEASYSVPDSKPSGQSSGNWNTVSRQVSTTPSDSGGSSGGK